MSQTFTTAIDVQSSPERVFAVMTDIDRWHEWTPSVTSVKRLGGAPFKVGTRALIKQPGFPPALWTISVIEPGRSFSWVSRAPGLHVTGVHSVEPLASGSRAILTLHYQGFFGVLFARLTRAITERYIRLEASGLKARSENPSFVHTQRPRA